MTDILNYNLTLTVNSTVFNTTVPADSTAVDIFAVFQNVDRTAFTNYSLSVAAVNSIGSSSFTRPVSVGKAQRYKHAYISNPRLTKLCIVHTSNIRTLKLIKSVDRSETCRDYDSTIQLLFYMYVCTFT